MSSVFVLPVGLAVWVEDFVKPDRRLFKRIRADTRSPTAARSAFCLRPDPS